MIPESLPPFVTNILNSGMHKIEFYPAVKYVRKVSRRTYFKVFKVVPLACEILSIISFFSLLDFLIFDMYIVFLKLEIRSYLKRKKSQEKVLY